MLSSYLTPRQQLVLGLWQGFWLFFDSPVHAWWLSVTAIFLNASWSLHNVIAWMKIRPFLSKRVSYIFIGTIILAQPYWVLEIYANFAYFHGISTLFLETRPWEALCRDPWWILTTIYLFWIIKTQYEMTLREIVRISPRFTIMLIAMIMSIIFIIFDILSVTGVLKLPGPTGINPFWKFAFVFKCLTDSVVLDDFKMALDRLRAFKISRLGSFSGDMSDSRNRNRDLVATWEEMERESTTRTIHQVRSPDGDYIHSSNYPFKPKQSRRVHKDSIVSPDHTSFHSSSVGLDPEDIVPSAIVDQPMRTLETAHYAQPKYQHHFINDMNNRNSRDRIAENDYAEALREVNIQRGGSPSRPAPG